MERSESMIMPDIGREAIERLTTTEVMSIARISRATLWRRVATGRLPMPVDRGRQALFVKQSVFAALQVESAQPLSVTVTIEQRLDALRRRREKKLDSVSNAE